MSKTPAKTLVNKPNNQVDIPQPSKQQRRPNSTSKPKSGSGPASKSSSPCNFCDEGSEKESATSSLTDKSLKNTSEGTNKQPSTDWQPRPSINPAFQSGEFNTSFDSESYVSISYILDQIAGGLMPTAADFQAAAIAFPDMSKEELFARCKGAVEQLTEETAKLMGMIGETLEDCCDSCPTCELRKKLEGKHATNGDSEAVHQPVGDEREGESWSSELLRKCSKGLLSGLRSSDERGNRESKGRDTNERDIKSPPKRQSPTDTASISPTQSPLTSTKSIPETAIGKGVKDSLGCGVHPKEATKEIANVPNFSYTISRVRAKNAAANKSRSVSVRAPKRISQQKPQRQHSDGEHASTPRQQIQKLSRRRSKAVSPYFQAGAEMLSIVWYVEDMALYRKQHGNM